MRAARDAGLDCGVFLMPMLPHLTDSVAALDATLAAVADAGASYVVWTALYLKPGVRQWWFAWLQRQHPDLVARYARLYAAGPYAPPAYRRWLADRIEPLIARHGLVAGAVDSATGTVRSRSAGIVRAVAQSPQPTRGPTFWCSRARARSAAPPRCPPA